MNNELDALEFTDFPCNCSCMCDMILNVIEAQNGVCTYCVSGDHQWDYSLDNWNNEGGTV